MPQTTRIESVSCRHAYGGFQTRCKTLVRLAEGCSGESITFSHLEPDCATSKELDEAKGLKMRVTLNTVDLYITIVGMRVLTACGTGLKQAFWHESVSANS